MLTNLVAGEEVPSWDALLLRALHEAVLGIADERTAWRFAVRNEEGRIYRQIVALGDPQFVNVRRQLDGLNFRIHKSEGIFVAERGPDPSAWSRF